MKRAKKVRFQDPLVEHPPCGRLSAAASPRNPTEAPASDDPKTSEFSFFKKLKMHVGCDNSSKLLLRENNQLEWSKAKKHNWGEPSTATNNGGEVACKERVAKFSSSAGSAELCAADLLISPQVVDSKRSDKTGMIEDGNKNDESYFLVMTNERSDHDKDPRFSSLPKTSTSAGNDYFMTDATKLSSSKTGCVEGDLFSKKRRKLQGWVARTMFPQKNEELKGFDVVSLLLGRLHPENSETNQIETLKPKQGSREAKCQLDNTPKSDDRLMGSRTLSSKFIECEQPYLMDAGTSSYKGNKICGRHLPNTSSESTCFPTIECANQMLLGCRKRDVDPCYLSRTYNKKSSDSSSPGTLSDVTAKSYGSVQTQNLRRLTFKYEPLQEQVLDDDSSSIWYSRLDSPSACNIFSSNPVSSSSCVTSRGNESLYEYEKQDTGWMNGSEASNFNTLSDSVFFDPPEKCRSSALATLVVSNQINNDSDEIGVRQWPFDLPGWDVDQLNKGETTYGFNSTALMRYQQNPETKTVSNRLLPSYFLPTQGFVDDTEKGFEAQNKHVYVRSCPPLGSPSKELIPAESSDLYHSASNHWLTSETCLNEKMVSKRSCPYEEAILSCVPIGNAYPSYPDYHEPVTECSSSYLLLEDDRDMQTLENKDFHFDSAISLFSGSHLSSSVELLRPSLLHRLQWRDTEADEFSEAGDFLTQSFY